MQNSRTQITISKDYTSFQRKQLKILSGNVVNTPADLNSTVNMLPRSPDNSGKGPVKTTVAIREFSPVTECLNV